LFAVLNLLIEIVELDDLGYRPRLRGVVDDLVIVGRVERLMSSKAHERVAVRRAEIDSRDEFLADEAMELGSELRAAAEDAFNAVADEVDFLAQNFEQLGRGEDALDVVVAAEDRQGLVDAVLLVEVGFLNFAAFEAFDDPAGVEVDTEGDTAAELGQMFDRNPNLYADISARFAETAPIPRFVAAFFQKYPDRVLYGTDMAYNQRMFSTTFRILESHDEHFYERDLNFNFDYHWALNGFGLPDPILKKVYADNARRVFQRARGSHA